MLRGYRSPHQYAAISSSSHKVGLAPPYGVAKAQTLHQILAVHVNIQLAAMAADTLTAGWEERLTS